MTIFLGICAAFVGAVIYESHPIIGDALMQSFSLGYYPSGPDAPFGVGAVLWSFSIVVLVFVGVAAGLAARKLATSRQHDLSSEQSFER